MAEHTQTPWKMVPCRTCSSMDTENAHRCGRFQLACPPANDYEGRLSTADADFLLRAVNCHEELVAALDLVDTVSWPEDYGGWRCTFDDKEWQQIQGALAKAKEGVADETRLRQQDLDEETL